MENKPETTDNQKEKVPFEINTPLYPEEVVTLFDEEIGLNLKGKSYFPERVRIIKKDGTKVVTNLTYIYYTTGGSQGDGTFYFSDEVRKIAHGSKKNYLFGEEITSITFLE
ncbi:MAG: hypothetical protein WC810_25160 [Janthinobacterium sp.]|jgi:hypothetical protein